MKKGNCGNCMFQGDLRNKQMFCFFDLNWHDMADSCKYWKRYSSNIKKEDRKDLAINLRNSIAEEKRAIVNKRFQIKLLIIGFLAGIISAVIIQCILKKLSIL